MKKVRIIGRDQPTTDFGVLLSGEEYNISNPLADFLIRRELAVPVAAKKAAKKKAAKKK